MITFFTNTVSNLTTVRLDSQEIYFISELTYEDYLFAVKQRFAEPNGNFISFFPDGEKKFFNYIKDKMKENGTLRNNRGKSIR